MSRTPDSRRRCRSWAASTPDSISSAVPWCRTRRSPRRGGRLVSPGYFDAYGLRLIGDAASWRRINPTRSAWPWWNERFVETYLTGLDPLRERLWIAPRAPGSDALGAAVEWQIVGVYHNVSNDLPIGQPVRPEIYLPFAQNPVPGMVGAIRTRGDLATPAKAIAAAVQSLDPNLPVSQVLPLQQLVDRFLSAERLNMALLTGLAAVALLLAAVGIYGVMAFLVGQRTREIGLRIALGAGQAQVLGQVVREGLALTIVGLGIGLVGAYFVGVAMQSMLLGTGKMDLRVAAAVCGLLLITALAACLAPARRASTIDPMSALRQS